MEQDHAPQYIPGSVVLLPWQKIINVNIKLFTEGSCTPGSVCCYFLVLVNEKLIFFEYGETSFTYNLELSPCLIDHQVDLRNTLMLSDSKSDSGFKVCIHSDGSGGQWSFMPRWRPWRATLNEVGLQWNSHHLPPLPSIHETRFITGRRRLNHAR